MTYAGDVFILIGFVFIAFGLYGNLRHKNFYIRILISAKIDTVAFLIIMLGLLFKSGLSYFSLKVLLIGVIVLITNPVAAHSIAKSAHRGGLPLKKEDQDG